MVDRLTHHIGEIEAKHRQQVSKMHNEMAQMQDEIALRDKHI